MAGPTTSLPTAESIETSRLRLEPQRAADADELHAILDDARLHDFIGGTPLDLETLRARYLALESGRSPDGSEAWLNWTLRLRPEAAAIGTVQADVMGDEARAAWVVGVAWQGQGYASEAAIGLVGWLRGQGVTSITARIHPLHEASMAVAKRAGFSPTDEVSDGEVVWRWTADSA